MREVLGANYAKVWVAAAISALGDGVSFAALPLLAASLTRNPTEVAAVTLFQTLPWLFFTLVSGALVDRLDRRVVMWSVDAGRCAIQASLALLVLSGRANIPLLCVLAFLLGSLQTLFDNASQSILPSIVEKSLLERANARMYGAQTVSQKFIGPPLGALLFTVAAASSFALDAASFAAASALAFFLVGAYRPASVAGRGERSLLGQIGEGLRWLWGHQLLRPMGLALGVMNLTSSAGFSVFVLYALEVLQVTEREYGVLLVASAVGSLLGAAGASRLSKRLGPGPLLFSAVALLALSAVGIGLTSSVVVVATMMGLSGFALVVWNVITVSLRQSIIPDHLLGRVNSAYRLLAWGTLPLGAAAGGSLARTLGLRAPYLLGGAGLALVSLMVARFVNTRTIEAARASAIAAAPVGDADG